jgi:thiol-disulfide isomerase/thioredoxin
MNGELINLNNHKLHKRNKMIVAISIVLATLAIIIWNYLIENPVMPDIQIPESKNITYNIGKIGSYTPTDIVTNIDDNLGKPVLIYLYTTWCSSCKKQLPVINEMARKFQNTDLQVIAIAIDRNMNEQVLIDYLFYYGNIYFKPNYLLYNDGLVDILKTKSIEYNNRIPLTILVGRDGKISSRFVGYKSEDYLNRIIMRALSVN